MIILSVDYGDVRTGIAVCDSLEMLASPICVIKETYEPKLIEKIKEIIAEYKAQMVVVGSPVNMDGTKGERAEKCAEFANELNKSLNIPVNLWDERMTTISAHKALNVTDTKGKKRKAVIDEVAATIILQNYLDYRKSLNKNGD